MVDMTRSRSRYTLWSLLPLLVFVGGTLAVLVGPPIFDDDDGLGTGLLMFAAYASVAFIWGGLDGFLGRPVAWVAVRWVVVATATAVAIGIQNSWGYFGQAVNPFVFDLIESVIFLSLLIVGPALLGSILGRYVHGTPTVLDEHR